MTNRRPEPQHEWWKDNSDQLSQRAFLESYRQAQRVIVVTRQYAQCEADRKAVLDAALLKRAELESNVADKDAALREIARRLQAEADNLAKLQARNLALRAETEAATAAAARSAQAFQQQYDQRPVECSAALRAMARPPAVPTPVSAGGLTRLETTIRRLTIHTPGTGVRRARGLAARR